ncbi:hypothetical protein B0O99DRAFT_684489 [Bisporella sp. PMI_857]|nr:hypothetical protein B0O99DRAFT_684489 [Bisporella sp. PMI_857]
MIDPTIITPGKDVSSVNSGAFGWKDTYYKAIGPQAYPSDLKNRWREVVHEYTRESLTFPSDIFPALAGLTKQIKRARKCEYYAGLREDNIATDLLWIASDKYKETLSDFLRIVKWRAPTWSWASISSPATYADSYDIYIFAN